MKFKLRFIFYVVPFILKITEDMPENAGAMTISFYYGKIRQKFIDKKDEGIQQHEMQHGKDMLTNLLGFTNYTHLEMEVRAYKEQLKYYADDRTELFAEYISTGYKDISITKEAALSLLRSKEF